MKKLICLTIIALLLACGNAWAGSRTITLAWDYPYEAPDLAGFRIYQAGASGQYDLKSPALVVSDPAARQATLPKPLPDGTYYWAMTAFDRVGNESGLSPELRHDLDATAPPVPAVPRVVVTVIVQSSNQ